MDLIICLKQVPDLQQIRIKRETREPVTEGVPLIFGEMDKNALEEAVKIKEKSGGTVSVLSIGSPKLRDTIKEALAAGADQAFIMVEPGYDNLDSGPKAALLAAAIRKISKFDLILLGEGSADNYSGQTGPRLAQLLGLPLLSYVKQLEPGNGTIKAVRNMEQYMETVEARLPAVVTVTSGINQPRIPSLMQILRASKKPITEFKPADIGVNPEQVNQRQTVIASNLAPIEQRQMVILEGAKEENLDTIVNALVKEGVVRS
jgi:electron transfer flavoprotein beta subunit